MLDLRNELTEIEGRIGNALQHPETRPSDKISGGLVRNIPVTIALARQWRQNHPISNDFEDYLVSGALLRVDEIKPTGERQTHRSGLIWRRSREIFRYPGYKALHLIIALRSSQGDVECYVDNHYILGLPEGELPKCGSYESVYDVGGLHIRNQSERLIRLPDWFGNLETFSDLLEQISS